MPPGSSAHRSRTLQSTTVDRAVDGCLGYHLLTCLNHTVPFLSKSPPQVLWVYLVPTTSVTLCLCPSVGTL